MKGLLHKIKSERIVHLYLHKLWKDNKGDYWYEDDLVLSFDSDSVHIYITDIENHNNFIYDGHIHGLIAKFINKPMLCALYTFDGSNWIEISAEQYERIGRKD